MLSGIGPADKLSSLGISVVADFPDVGANLRDHAFSIVELLVTPNVLTLWQWYENATEELLAQEQYSANRSGPLGWNNGFVYAAFRLPNSVWDGVNGTHYNSLPNDRPHALVEFSTVSFLSENASAITAWASLVQPQASGHVTLQSSDYRDDPLIYTNYYGSPADKAAILYSYKKVRAILEQQEVAKLTVEELYPGTNVTSDKDIWAAIQANTFSFRHPVGTVAIGKAFNSNWRLKGVEGIRVVDSSTFPYPTTCHPQAVVYALANRAAKDILKADGGSS